MNAKILWSVVGGVVVGLLIGYCCFVWHGKPATSTAQMCNHEAMMGNNMGNMGSMEHQMMSMTDRMKGKTGDELDKIFLEDMIVHHQGAVDMAQILVKNTKRPELQKMGADIIQVQTAEIAQMNQWLQAWFK